MPRFSRGSPSLPPSSLPGCAATPTPPTERVDSKTRPSPRWLLLLGLLSTSCSLPLSPPSDGVGGASSTGCLGECDGSSGFSTSGFSVSVSTGSGPATCVDQPLPTVALDVDGTPVLPEPNTPVDVTIEGRVLSSPSDRLVVDTCPPGGDCMPSLSTLTLAGVPQGGVAVPADVFVSIRYYAAYAPSPSMPDGIGAHVVVTNLITWGSLSNVAWPYERTWFVAESMHGSGFVAPAGIDPVVIEELASFCGPTHHKLKVQVSGQPVALVDLGGTVAFNGDPSHPGSYTLTNLVNDDDATGVRRGYFMQGM